MIEKAEVVEETAEEVKEKVEEFKEKAEEVEEKAEALNDVELTETKEDRIKKILSQLTGAKSTLSNLAVAEQIKVHTYFIMFFLIKVIYSLLYNHICL